MSHLDAFTVKIHPKKHFATFLPHNLDSTNNQELYLNYFVFNIDKY